MNTNAMHALQAYGQSEATGGAGGAGAAGRLVGKGKSAGGNGAGPDGVGAVGQSDFGDLVAGFTQDLIHTQAQAGEAVKAMQRGVQGSVHETMMSMSKAEIAFKFAMTARNKLVEAYREVLRMGM